MRALLSRFLGWFKRGKERKVKRYSDTLCYECQKNYLIAADRGHGIYTICGNCSREIYGRGNKTPLIELISK